ncbi:MAG: shikimate kinase [Clostridia bacterium]|nr:MAG: shikimate kinase [Clostridia bacterium]
MGAGKSVVGRALARRLRKRFVDTDSEIEAMAGLAVPEIFSRHGEPYFRQLEKQVVRRVAAGEHQVIATGGGTVVDEENARLLQATGVIVWLMASAEAVYRRVGQATNRPLLSGPGEADPRQRIQELLARRETVYRQRAGFSLNTDGLTPWQVVREIEARLSYEL